ncbi:MAG: hypothetical protein JXK16_09065 [Thiotrichales bacterium]|nr:hypothetical protein [Thiotrichales bacterium]
MAMEITPMVAQQPERRVGKHTIFPNQAHQIQLYVSKKSLNQSLLTVQILFTRILGKNMTSKMLLSKAHNKANVNQWGQTRLIWL